MSRDYFIVVNQAAYVLCDSWVGSSFIPVLYIFSNIPRMVQSELS